MILNTKNDNVQFDKVKIQFSMDCILFSLCIIIVGFVLVYSISFLLNGVIGKSFSLLLSNLNK